MLSDEAARLFKSGVNAGGISKQLNVTRGHVIKLLIKAGIDLPRCKICNRQILSINNAHTKMHNLTVSEYINKFPDEKHMVKYLIWNKGLTKDNNKSVARCAEAMRIRMSSRTEKLKRIKQNKEMWKTGRFVANRSSCLKANKAWVRKIKSVNKQERKLLLSSFVQAGNLAQNKIRAKHALDLDFFKKKYPWAINPRIFNCVNCNKQFIKCDGGSKSSFCSSGCYWYFLKNTRNPNYYINESLKSRIIEVKCKGCDVKFLSVASKWSRKFCCAKCRLRWLENHPNCTIKHRYYSEKFSSEYVYDSSYELSFIKWAEYNNGVLTLERNRPIIKLEEWKMRYFPDFLINNSKIIEIKADYFDIYNIDREIKKIVGGLNHELDYKLITNKELYKNKAIDNERLNEIVHTDGNFIGGHWNEVIK